VYKSILLANSAIEEGFVVTQNNTAAIPPQPEVIACYSYGWNKLWKPFWMLLLVWIIYCAIGAVTGWIPILNYIVGVFLTGPLGYGMSYVFLKAARGQNLEIPDLFAVFKNYLHAFLAVLLTGIIVGVGFIFLIIPGIYLSVKLSFVAYLIVDKNLEVIPAIQTSWKMTDGHFWQIFLIGLLAIPIMIAGFICLGVGAIVAIMLISVTQASMYYAVDAFYPSQVPPAPVAP
jgi:uncharacterized membrane protein